MGQKGKGWGGVGDGPTGWGEMKIDDPLCDFVESVHALLGE